MKVQDVKRPDVAAMMAHKPAEACRHVPVYPDGKATHLISDEDMGSCSATWSTWKR